MRLYKKGQDAAGFSYIRRLILYLIILLVLTTIISFKVVPILKGSAVEGSCATTILANAYYKPGGIDMFKINCPMKILTIDMARLGEWDPSFGTKSGVAERFKLDFGEKENILAYNTNRILAHELYECWSQFGQGNLEVFSELTPVRHCVICSRINFDGEVKKFFKENSLGPINTKQNYDRFPDKNTCEGGLSFDTYLRCNKEPFDAFQDSSYYEYLLDDIDKIAGYPTYEYDVDKVYAILFVNEYPEFIGKKYEELRKIYNNVRNTLSGESAYDPNKRRPQKVNGIQLVEYDQLQGHCDQIMN